MINPLVSWLMKQRLPRIEQMLVKPIEIQEAQFQALIRSAKDTEWGKKYDYSSIRQINTFQERVPISTYEQLYPYIERCMRGEQNLLWNTPIFAFSKSSGTTNARSKFIPVSQEALQTCHYRGGKDMIALYVSQYPDTKVFSGKSLAIGGSYQTNHLNEKTYYGDVSAVIMKNLPFWAEYLRTPSLKTALLDKWETKLPQMALETSKENVTSLAGVPTWTIVLIEKILEMTGKSSILEVWENLEVFFHGAVAFTPYRNLFKQLIPSDQMHYLEVYNASEGFFGLQDQRNSEEMLLLLDYGVFYEFIPLEQLETENPKALTLAEVELNKNYALIISTNGGLWRYQIGDTIRFTSLKPYRIKISGRTKSFINAFGEEVVVENADVAITQACQATNAIMSNYTVAPIFIQSRKQGGHEWIIEFEKEPDNLEHFTKTLDETLRHINSDYDAKRHQNLALLEPKIHVAPKGTFLTWLGQKNKLGGQHKVPRLSNSREYVEEILKILY